MSSKVLCVLLLLATMAFGETNWVQLSPLNTPPSARMAHSAAYDAANNRLIVFGGASGNINFVPTLLNDVWVLSNADGTSGAPSWTQLTPTGGPPTPRAYHTAAYDPTSNTLIVFGGNRSVGYCFQTLNDTWLLSNANGLGGTAVWTQLSPTNSAPGIRNLHSANYDAANNRLIVIGGQDACRSNYDEVWVLSNANGTGGPAGWTQLVVPGTTPGGRVEHTTVYDAANNELILFGGLVQGGSNDVWVLSNGNGLGGVAGWEALSPIGPGPEPRWMHHAVYDEAQNTMLVFGGYASSTKNDLWMLTNANGVTGEPTWLPVAGNPLPPSRDSGSMVMNPTNGKLIVFGGRNCSGSCTPLNDTWVFSAPAPPLQPPDISKWIEVIPSGGSPTNRTYHSAVYDQVNNRMVVFGGYTEPLTANPPLLNDVWVLTNADGTGGGSEWIRVTPTNSPPSPRAYHTAVYDPNSNRMIVFGGNRLVGACFNTLNDILVLVNANGLGGPAYWLPFAPTNPPSVREKLSAVYDVANNRMIIFSGYDCSGVNADTWVLTNANGLGGDPTWIQVPVTGPIPTRISHSAVLDSVNNRMIVFGGLYSGRYNDVWVLTNANGLGGTAGWIQISSNAPIPARVEHSAVYKPEANEMFVFGGEPQAMTNDVWVLSNANGLGGNPEWSQYFSIGTVPFNRKGHSAVLNTDNGKMIVHGGLTCDGGCRPLRDVHVLTTTLLLTPPVITSVTPGMAAAGTEVILRGSNLTHVTAVLFNGLASQFNVDADDQLRAVVPLYACPGYVTAINAAGPGRSPMPLEIPQYDAVLMNSNEAAFDAALCNGRTVSFDFDGAITFSTNKVIMSDITIDGSGRNVTLSGGNNSRLFYVSPGVKLTLRNLTIVNGRNPRGAAIFNEGGSVVAINCVFTNNRALGASGGNAGGSCGSGGAGAAGEGGVIFSQAGDLLFTNCSFVGNIAGGGNGGNGGPRGWTCGAGSGGAGGMGIGGAIYSVTGNVALVNSSFSNNAAIGGFGGNGGAAGTTGGNGGYVKGGAIYHLGGLMVASKCTFAANYVQGGNGGSSHGTGGAAYGGALFMEAGSRIACWDTAFSGNSVTGGIGVASTYIYGSGNFGTGGGPGGHAGGGAIYNAGGFLSISNGTVEGNRLLAGAGGSGSSGYISGGSGAGGGNAEGGGIYLSGSSNVFVNMTWCSNRVTSGNGGAGGNGSSRGGDAGRAGQAAGGSVFSRAETNYLLNCTIALGQVTGGIPGTPGAAYGLPAAPTAVWGANLASESGVLALDNSIVAYGIGAGNCSSNIVDDGNNICSDVSAEFTLASSRNAVDPRLESIAWNGGPTRTMALQEPSPAIDGGGVSTAALTDQRSYLRIGVPDIGAYEYNGVVPGADLAVFANGPLGTVLAGSNFTYSITVTNLGPLGASGVVLTSSLPEGVVFVSGTSGQGSCSNTASEVRCDLGDLDTNAAVSATMILTSAVPGGGNLWTRVSGDVTDTKADNNTVVVALTVAAPSGDIDADGLPNWWEMSQGFDLENANGNDGPAGDPDQDGFSNYKEYVADTDPRGSGSFPRIISIEPVGEGVRLEWQCGIDSTQYLQGSIRLGGTNGAWYDLITNYPPTPLRGVYTNYPGTNIMFYRLRLNR